MKLKTLMQGLDVVIKGKKELEIHGICAHSKQVAPGDLFIANSGAKTEGTLYIDEAIKAGAYAILTDLYNPFLPQVTQIISKNPREIESEIAKRFYKNPSKSLDVIGVTGTNGKTTTTYLIKHLLEDQKNACGLIGTIETQIADHRFFSSLTTPDVISINKFFREMIHKGCSKVVMEVSSHALIQKRIDQIEFDIAVFTNLTQDHLDFHKTMQAYAEAKALLFKHLSLYQEKKKKFAVINFDDPYFELMKKSCKEKVLGYSLKNPVADVFASNIVYKTDGTSFTLHLGKEMVNIKMRLIGEFNVYNALAAAAVAFYRGVSSRVIAERFSSFAEVKGRLEKVKNKKRLHVFVDYAHTDKALENVLLTLRLLTKGSLTVVFGCGGDRDKGKRPLMGKVASLHADKIILTSDNPRSEDPNQIMEEILSGIDKKEKVIMEVDRKKAIEQALSSCKKNDIVLIAGKGHEMTQTFKEKAAPFSDVAVVENY